MPFLCVSRWIRTKPSTCNYTVCLGERAFCPFCVIRFLFYGCWNVCTKLFAAQQSPQTHSDLNNTLNRLLFWWLYLWEFYCFANGIESGVVLSQRQRSYNFHWISIWKVFHCRFLCQVLISSTKTNRGEGHQFNEMHEMSVVNCRWPIILLSFTEF